MARDRPYDELVAAAAQISTATAHEAGGRIGALPVTIQALSPTLRLCGRALPVRSPPGDNLFLHHAIYAATPGEVLVVDTSNAAEYGYWGEVMTVAAQQRGIAGLILAGGIRDSQRLVEIGFPVFSIGRCIRGTVKDPAATGSIGQPVVIGDVEIARGDIVLGDADGVVILPAEAAAAIIAEARSRDRAELDIFARLRSGESTVDIYRLPSVRDEPAHPMSMDQASASS